jgi:hypothetical protein
MGYCSSPFLSLLRVLPKGTNLSFLNFDSQSFFSNNVIIFQGLTNTQSGVLANFTITPTGGTPFNITVPVGNIIALGV